MKLTQENLFIALSILSKNFHNIYTTDHAFERMQQRNITYDECLDVIANPQKLLDVRQTDQGHYAYKIHGKDANKHVVIAVHANKRQIHIVTVINKLYN